MLNEYSKKKIFFRKSKSEKYNCFEFKFDLCLNYTAKFKVIEIFFSIFIFFFDKSTRRKCQYLTNVLNMLSLCK